MVKDKEQPEGKDAVLIGQFVVLRNAQSHSHKDNSEALVKEKEERTKPKKKRSKKRKAPVYQGGFPDMSHLGLI